MIRNFSLGQFLLRLTLWLLLTANFTWLNVLIGGIVAALLPPVTNIQDPPLQWLKQMGKLLLAIPQAYLEAFQLLLWPHRHEAIVKEPATSRSPRMIFLDVLLITFTPKTIVLKYDPEGWYEVHRVQRRIDQ
jgi:multicomponent Na+:H+ antiporter subunit E